MKKILALLLAAALLLSATACGNTAEPAHTTAVAASESTDAVDHETTPEATAETEYIGIAQTLLQSDDTVTESYSDLLDYESKLHELGFVELYFGTDFCTPESITYNDDVFRFDFSYFDSNEKQEDKWVLYGMKSDSNKNITNYSDAFLLGQEIAYTFDSMEGGVPEHIRSLPVCPQITETNSRDSWEDPSFSVYLYSAYYPTSNNLYNCYWEDAPSEYSYVPGIIKRWNIVLSDYYATLELPEFNFCVYRLVNPATKELTPEFGANTTLSNIYCYYEPGMTIKDWAASAYNLEGWTWFQDDRSSGIISPEHGVNVYVILAEYHDDGSMYTIDEYLSDPYAPGVPLLKYDDYCALFDK